MRFEWRIVGLVVGGLGLALAVIWLVGGFIPYPTADNLATRWDHYRYIEMARHPFDPADALAREAPYCWRILTPLLVFISPLDWRVSFMAITLVGMGGAALAFWAYLARLSYDWAARLFGLALFFSLAGLIFNLRDYYLTDALALLAITLGFYYLVGSKDAALPVWSLFFILGLGVLAKETVLALLPLVLFSPGLSRRAKIFLSLTPLGLWAAVRLLWPALNDYSYLAEAQDVLSHQFFGEGWLSLLERLNFALLGTWGPALVLLLYQPKETGRYLLARRAELFYLAIIYGQLLIAHNVDRLLVYGFVVILPLLTHKAVRLRAERGLNIYAMLVIALGLQLAYFYGRPPLWFSLAVCTGLIIWLWLPARSQTSRPFLPERNKLS